MELQAPIAAVTVHPARARITRRGRITLAAGASELVVPGLPLSLLDESVRVEGRSEAGVRVVGVDLVHRDLVDAPDERVRAAERAVAEAESAVAAVDALDAGDAARAELLSRLALRSGDRLAAALADGSAEPPRVAEIGAAVAEQIVEVSIRRRAHAQDRTSAVHALHAAQAELERLRTSGRQRRDAVIGVEADTGGELELDLSYVVEGASWSPAYDARLDDTGKVALTWYGMVSQATGEDWPPCALTLSTARPAVSATVPELDPWWIDVSRPPPAPRMAAPDISTVRSRMAVESTGYGYAAPVAAVVARPVESTVAAEWQLIRPVAVPGDSTPHRTTVAAFALEAVLDHVVAPVLGPAAHLRATLTNTSGRLLLAGPVSTFVDNAFVGTTSIEQTAPDAEVELALGVDDLVVVERELAERTATRARFGSTRGALERWTISVTNRRAAPTRVTVRDRIPVSRQAEIKIVDVALSPEPTDRDELGRIEWTAPLEPGATWKASVRFGVEHPKDTEVTGWR